ncbi:hypothetical protein CEXT_197191 [Caerostris extrusa]|uniref:Uncharacterized protein n=1 Tax=Caerostris extrusa TaxID=172846 RepID=A0AAV4X228_CAEEX|nr:hypothetical protein CEXT_197191 [Caerostris extrusa]
MECMSVVQSGNKWLFGSHHGQLIHFEPTLPKGALRSMARGPRLWPNSLNSELSEKRLKAVELVNGYFSRMIFLIVVLLAIAPQVDAMFSMTWPVRQNHKRFKEIQRVVEEGVDIHLSVFLFDQ